jgi:hypothetical protein
MRHLDGGGGTILQVRFSNPIRALGSSHGSLHANALTFMLGVGRVGDCVGYARTVTLTRTALLHQPEPPHSCTARGCKIRSVTRDFRA